MLALCTSTYNRRPSKTVVCVCAHERVRMCVSLSWSSSSSQWLSSSPHADCIIVWIALTTDTGLQDSFPLCPFLLSLLPQFSYLPSIHASFLLHLSCTQSCKSTVTNKCLNTQMIPQLSFPLHSSPSQVLFPVLPPLPFPLWKPWVTSDSGWVVSSTAWQCA